MNTRPLITAALLAGALLLGGCAAINTVSADVSSFGDWPAERKAGTYAFERLPSQQAQAEQAVALEQAAAKALAKAGFTPAAEGQQPEVLVQLGARFTLTGRSPWDDPLWWNGGFGRFHRGPWMSPSWSLHFYGRPTRYESEVAVLLRDRASGRALYESRASTDGNTRADAEEVAALYEAALADFPRPALSPRRVTVPLGAAKAP